MNVLPTRLDGVLVIEPTVYRDARGWFTETWHHARFRDAGLHTHFVQDNAAWSGAGVVRGLHYQWPDPQAKLVSVLHGAVYDVAVDVRPDSPTFRHWVAVELSADSQRQLWIPEGFAHGYAALGEGALVAYRCSAHHVPAHDRAIRWDDPAIGIDWPIADPVLSEKDRTAPFLDRVPRDHLPR